MVILRKILILCLLTVASTAFGKDSNIGNVERPNTKKVNFGIKAGFNSTMFMVSELKIKDVTIDEFQNNYKIGYFGSLFMRINMKKHFIMSANAKSLLTNSVLNIPILNLITLL